MFQVWVKWAPERSIDIRTPPRRCPTHLLEAIKRTLKAVCVSVVFLASEFNNDNEHDDDDDDDDE